MDNDHISRRGLVLGLSFDGLWMHHSELADREPLFFDGVSSAARRRRLNTQAASRQAASSINTYERYLHVHRG